MIDYLLPGDWRDLHVTSPQRTKRAVERYVQETIGPRDDLAQLRADARQWLSQAIEDARTGRATAVHMAKEILPGVPLPVSLIVHEPAMIWNNHEELLSYVTELPTADPTQRQCLSSLVELVDLENGTVFVKRRREVQLRPDSTIVGVLPAGQEPPSDLKLEYWLPDPAGLRTALFTFSTALTDLGDALDVFCSAIVATARWHDPSPTIAKRS